MLRGREIMTGKEKLQEVLNLVDMTKVDLPSYNISIKKYDIIANAYTKVIFLLSYLEVCLNQKDSEEEIKRLDVARKTLAKISSDPLVYCYDNTVQQEKAIVQKAADEVCGPYFDKDSPRFKTMQNSVKKSLMIKNMKDMLSSLQSFLNNHPDNVIDFCMSDENFDSKMLEYNKIQQEAKDFETQSAITVEPTKSEEELQVEQNIETPKASFWKRIFSKVGAR